MTDTAPALILGTAGHIDHGKSSLVLALTGTDPDRLAEEKQRGITIELGFARLELPDKTIMGVVDVPGHERFVRQMIAGSTGIDMALLCIAADDGVMPQTIEHVAVLELLGITACVVALTKADLVDEEWTGFVADEVRARLASTPFAAAEIVPVSSRTGSGLDELRSALARSAKGAKRTKREAPLRLPIDRAFTVRGAGTVVTGTLWSGTASVGSEVEILPHGLRARIRGVQVHGRPVERAEAGRRVALNLHAVGVDEVRPGDFAAAPDSISVTDRFDASVSFLGAAGWSKPLESGSRMHVAHGTREVTGRVLLMNGRASLAQGETAYAQVRLDEPLPAAWGDRFVLRSYSPMHVVGGGMVLRAHPRRTSTMPPADEALLDALRNGSEASIAQAAFSLASLPVTPIELAQTSGLDEKTARREFKSLEAAGGAVRLEGETGTEDRWASRAVLQRHRTAIENALLRFHAEQPSQPGIAKEALRRRCMPRATPACFDALLADAISQGVAVVSGGEASHPRAGAGAKRLEEQATELLASTLQEAAGAPPMLDELVAGSGLAPSLAYRALNTLEQQGRIVRIGQVFYLDVAALERFEQAVRARLSNDTPAAAAELKDAMGTSRKYAIPLLEYFDATGLTRRIDDKRVLNA